MSQGSLFASAPVESTLLPAAFPAPISVSPVAEPDSLASVAAYGSRCFESSPSYARAGFSLKTFLLCALAELTSFSLVWKRQATPLGRSWWVLGRSALLTDGIVSGLWGDEFEEMPEKSWGTPQVFDATDIQRSPEAMERAKAKGGCANLREQVHEPSWGTPRVTTNGGAGALRENSKSRLEDQVHEAWPSPRASDADGGRATPIRHRGDKAQCGPCLAEAVGMWPTPKTADGRAKGNGGNRNSPGLDQMARQGDLADWPTPATRDHHAQGATHNTAAHSSSLATVVEKKLGTDGPLDLDNRSTNGSRRGSLNPDWVETLMGAPPGWTDLPEEIASALSATRIPQRSRKSSGGGS